MKIPMRNQEGFTLAEVLVALALAALVSSIAFATLSAQNKAYLAQTEQVTMQQNLRAGFNLMVSEIRQAGYDPKGTSGAGMISAQSDRIQFSMDRDGDGKVLGEPGEYLSYSIYASDGKPNLGRKSTNTAVNSAVAENIEALGFAYAIDSDGDGELDTRQGRVIWAVDVNGTWQDLDVNGDGLISEADDVDADGMIAGINTGMAVRMEDIRAVRVWMLARTEYPTQDFTAAGRYLLGRRVLTPRDHYRRRLFSGLILCRNLGS